MKTSVLLTIFTSASASACCIIPILGIIGGSGSILSSVAWLEPLRPYFIVSTFAMLGLAWYSAIKPTSKDECGCEPEKRTFFQSKRFLGIVTALSLILLSFPSYSRFIFQEENSVTATDDQDREKKITLAVNGMTCATCERHIESEVVKLSGVTSVKASYQNKSTVVEFDPSKIDENRIIAAINSTGYFVDNNNNNMKAQEKNKENCCSKGTCTTPSVKIPNEKSKNLKVLTSVDQIRDAFNKQSDQVRFIAILSSTCGWCLQGAEAVQKSVIEKMADKNISVIIVWTNMLETDNQEHAYKAASMFKDGKIVQFFDAENKFGDMVAKRLNPKGEKAWDIYLFYDKETEWNQTIPRPFDYAHQLNNLYHPWADTTKYFCGNDLTKRLNDITNSL
jgi:mercuric ion transport protein